MFKTPTSSSMNFKIPVVFFQQANERVGISNIQRYGLEIYYLCCLLVFINGPKDNLRNQVIGRKRKSVLKMNRESSNHEENCFD